MFPLVSYLCKVAPRFLSLVLASNLIVLPTPMLALIFRLSIHIIIVLIHSAFLSLQKVLDALNSVYMHNLDGDVPVLQDAAGGLYEAGAFLHIAS